jgi:hypothetical protein
MQENIAKQLVVISASLVFAAFVQPVQADGSGQEAGATVRPGDHPAVVVARMQHEAGYDYASKFYLHPARLALESVPPREMGDHPAVMIARSRPTTTALASAGEGERRSVAGGTAADGVEAN